jgi:hypothetical protein
VVDLAGLKDAGFEIVATLGRHVAVFREAAPTPGDRSTLRSCIARMLS